MRTSEQTDKLDAALAKAQAEFPAVKFDQKNPHFGNRFASLAAFLDAIRPVLAKHGISVIQGTEIRHKEDGTHYMVMLTRLACAGQFIIAGEWPIAVGKQQEMGSGGTYARRYSFAAAIGVAGEEDDDAGTVSKSEQNKAPKIAPNPIKPRQYYPAEEPVR